MSEMQHNKKREISVLNWLGTLILASIPGVNLILFIVWAFTSKRASKRNYAIASLILVVLAIVLSVLACAFFGERIVVFVESLSPAQTPAPIL